MKQFLRSPSQHLAEIHFNDFKSDWRKCPIFVTKTKLPTEKIKSQIGCGKDDVDGPLQPTSSTEVTLNILQMAILMRKNHILDLILSKSKDLKSPTNDHWFQYVETNLAKVDKYLAISCKSTLNLASKFNPEGLYKILQSILKDLNEKDQGHFWEKEPIREILHNAAINADSLSTR